MSTPGGNILAQALSALGTNDFVLYRWASKSTNGAGKSVQVYEEGITVRASVQAVDRSSYKQMGLNFSSKYIAIWSGEDVSVATRLQPNDQIGFMGRRFKVMVDDDWIPMDSWSNFIAIDIGADQGDP